MPSYRYVARPGGRKEKETVGPAVDELTTADVLNEVGEDATLARAALDAENARDTPRKGLVAKLEKLANADA